MSKAPPPPGADSTADSAAAAAKEKARREKEERRRLKEIELQMKNIGVGGQADKKKLSKAERRAIQEQQRAAKQAQAQAAGPGAGAGAGAGGGSPGGRADAGSTKSQAGPGAAGGSIKSQAGPGAAAAAAAAAAASGRQARVDMSKYAVVEDKRMHLYVHLDLPDHPPSSATALATEPQVDEAAAAAAGERRPGDVGDFTAGVRNAAFPPGPQVVVGQARDDYVSAEAGAPATVKVTGADGKPAVAALRDAVPPFASGPGQRRYPKAPASVAHTPVHPRIKEIGLRMATMEISGSNSRAIAMLLAFADAIADYTTPANKALTSHLTNYLSPQIHFLTHQRPMCIGMGNAIRWLKSEILDLPRDLTDDQAKGQLIKKIDVYIKERITAASDIIAEAGAHKIQDGDVVLTYGASSTVQNLLVVAREMGRRFRVIAVDSRPANEGRRLVRALVAAGFSGEPALDGVTYAPITALSSLMRDASKVLLGAEAFFANGTMLSRVGTAMVALAAHACHVPVIATCETYKFNERIQLDAVVGNELAVPDALMYKTGIPGAEPVGPQSDPALAAMEYSAYARDKYAARPRWNNRSALRGEPPAEAAGPGKKPKGAKAAPAGEAAQGAAALARLGHACPLSDWRANPRLRLLNPTLDITPPEFVSVIVTELGMIPTTSIPVVLREYKN
ncbi:hypothetical protein H4R18_004845 [Coemansia javaensis]|uniref:Translation initiation factor eIF2B subunit delta n=1 Tax=Coemansia javaensis TaxID=2761396 RepID=A0A9W8H9L5_9FUNG|nr:hypothetical protein H4R18_004845 [Coemansia javaensis]